MSCRWDRDAEDYLVDGEPCRRDEYGDPTRHCTFRRSCSNHVGYGENTCARCLGRTRNAVRRIVALAPLALFQALGVGVESEAAMLAAPAADPERWMWTQAHRRRQAYGLADDKQLAAALEFLADDDIHPTSLLGRWTLMLAEDYAIELPPTLDLTWCGSFLDRTLGRMAQDENQDFGLFGREVRKCANHLEAVIRNSSAGEKGAPCPRCKAPAPRLDLKHGHWCEDEDCERIHYPADPDRWVCPRDRSHVWEEDDYRKWVADVYEANKVEAS